MERDWCDLVDTIEAGKGGEKVLEAARKDLRDSLVGVAPIFVDKPFFMSDEFTLVDCCLGPILWRLPKLGVQVPQTKQTKPLFDYMNRIFQMKSFGASLSEQELEMRPTRAA